MDVYSLGVVLWELETGDAPWSSAEAASAIAFKVSQQDERPIIPDSTTHNMRRLIVDAWHPDPAQ